MSSALLGQPPIVGAMIVGVILERSLLGLPFPDMQAAFYPPLARIAA